MEDISFEYRKIQEKGDEKMDTIIKECNDMIKSFGDIPFDKALPHFQDKLWNIAEKYNMTGPELLSKYMDWLSKHNSESF